MFNVGDIVELSSAGGCYTTYDTFFSKYGISSEGFESGEKAPTDERLIIKDFRPHSKHNSEIVYVLEDSEQNVYLAADDYMEKVDEAAFKIGDEVEIVRHGFGVPLVECGMTVTITDIGLYGGRDCKPAGYRVSPAVGNTKHWEQGLKAFGGYIGEASFSPVSKKREHYDLIVAWAEGAEIQVYSSIAKAYVDVEYPRWKPTSEYRLKPNAEDLAKEVEIQKLESEIAIMQERLKNLKGGDE